MRAKGSTQFDPSRAWAVAEGFLARHGVSSSGRAVSPDAVKVLMAGVWPGCRFALLDRAFALAVATAGNERPGPIYRSLRAALAEEFDEPLQQVLAEVLRQRGFTAAAPSTRPAPKPGRAPLSGDGAIRAAEALLQVRPKPRAKGEAGR